MIRGILFDKDGTLVDFFSLWLETTRELAPEFLAVNGIGTGDGEKKAFLEMLGIRENRVDPEGALAYKSYPEIAEDICRAFREKGIRLEPEKVREDLIRLFDRYAGADKIRAAGLADMKTLIPRLKEMGLRVGLATADTAESAEKCLEALGVKDAFDYIGADDGVIRPKPAPDMFRRFQQSFGLKPEEILVVGDTPNDMRFAHENGGRAAGVLSGVSAAEKLEGSADYLIPSVRELPELLEKIRMED